MNQVIEKEITVGELREIYFADKYNIEIDTPDGFQPVVSWWDKGQLPMVEVVTKKGLKTRCATNHMIQLSNQNWLFADKLSHGDEILTKHGLDVVENVNHCANENCFDFEVGHANHRYWGDGISSHNSGKSFIASANIVNDAHSKGIYVVIVDTERSLDESWLQKLGVNTDPSVLTLITGATVDDVAKLLSELIVNYRADNDHKEYANRDQLLIVIDSLGMLITPNQEKQFNEGDLKGDMGLKAKQITAMVRVAVAKIASQRIGLIVTNHVYDSQDEYKPDTISGGKMLEYASSIIIQMNKLLLKEDEDGNKLKGSEVRGIKASIVVRKSRYAKPFEKVHISIPFDKGMDKYSGMFDLLEKKGIITKATAQTYSYTSPVTGEVITCKRKAMKKHFQQIMDEWEHWDKIPVATGFDLTDGKDEEDVE